MPVIKASFLKENLSICCIYLIATLSTNTDLILLPTSYPNLLFKSFINDIKSLKILLILIDLNIDSEKL